MLPSKKVLIYEIVGTVFIIFLGSAFHFTYELSGKLAIVRTTPLSLITVVPVGANPTCVIIPGWEWNGN